MAKNGSTNQSEQILATNPKFVPTAFDASRPIEMVGAEVDWQTAMKRAIRDSAELRRVLSLPPVETVTRPGNSPQTAIENVEGENNFPTFVPWEFLDRIAVGDPNDPLLRQVLPVAEESIEHPGFGIDPVGDNDALVAPGLLHKYHGRALMLAATACGIHCRYCFRREFPYHQDSGPANRWRDAVNYLREHPEIDEVLLSGGDPLTLPDASLDRLIGLIESVGHVRRIRIHTRMPIVIPQRITSELVDRLASSRLTAWFVVHVNHPRELDKRVLDRLARLIDRGIPVLNQAVLLRGVNDDAESLIELCRKLVNHRIQPYYLHQLDRVRGAAHFEVPAGDGQRLIEQVRAALPGYAVPTYATEQAGMPSKTPL